VNGVNIIGRISPSPKKRKVVHLEDDEDESDEDRGVEYSGNSSPGAKMLANGSVNGFVTGKGKAKRKNKANGLANGLANVSAKSATKYAQIQEQRRQLPIAKGAWNCRISVRVLTAICRQRSFNPRNKRK
jgi:hypothetical protein